MRKPLAALAVFTLVQVFASLIGWLSGYDFDTRNTGVALSAFVSIWVSACAALAAYGVA